MPNKSSTREFWLADAAPAEAPRCCPKGHALQPWTALPGYCDGCGQVIQHGEQVLDCRPCNWYLCPACSRQPSSASALWRTLSSFFGVAGASASPSPVPPSFTVVGQGGPSIVNDWVEASRTLVAFCVDYPATRVVPTAAELEGLWGSCQKLNPNAVAEAVSEQLSWSSGDLDWQPRLRALHALEHFHSKGGSAAEVAWAVLNQANELLQHLTQVPQCSTKASQLILTLMNPLGDAGSLEKLPSVPAAAKAPPPTAPRSATPFASQSASPPQPAPAASAAAAAAAVAAPSAKPGPLVPVPSMVAPAPLSPLAGDTKVLAAPPGDLLDFGDDLIDLDIPNERAEATVAEEGEVEAKEEGQSFAEEAEVAEDPKVTTAAQNQEPVLMAPGFQFRPPAAALLGDAASLGLAPIEDGLSRLGADTSGGTGSAAGAVAGLAALLDMSSPPLNKASEKQNLGNSAARVTLTAARFGA